jgi:hypothetical protein
MNGEDAGVEPMMFAGVGGSTLDFGGQWPRLLPSALRVRSLDGDLLAPVIEGGANWRSPPAGADASRPRPDVS